MCPYSENNLECMNIWQYYGINGHFFSFHIKHYAFKITLYVQCYSVLSSSTAYNSVNGVNLYNILYLSAGSDKNHASDST